MNKKNNRFVYQQHVRSSLKRHNAPINTSSISSGITSLSYHTKRLQFMSRQCTSWLNTHLYLVVMHCQDVILMPLPAAFCNTAMSKFPNERLKMLTINTSCLNEFHFNFLCPTPKLAYFCFY